MEFIHRLQRETHELVSCFQNPLSGPDNFVSLAKLACDYIHWVVDQILRNRIVSRKGLDPIVHTAREVGDLDIFTLNHDTLIESELRDAGLNCEAGFGDRSHGQFSVYEPGWLSKPRPDRVFRIFKLQGSLNWFLYRFPKWADQYAIPDHDPYHSRNEHGVLVHAIDQKAAFLSGTIVKEQRYGLGFWDELFTGFRQHLSGHRHLIVCGYGFGDPGVNLRVEQWARNLPGKNRLVILTPEEPEEFLPEKPVWLKLLYEHGGVVFVSKYLEDCELADIECYFTAFP